MESNQQGRFGPGSGRSSSSSSRKTKKNSLEKAPKQPQRGLGVAQLEKIRIQSQMMASYNLQSLHHPFHSNLIMEEDTNITLTFPPSSSSSSSLHPKFMMGCGESLSSADTNFGNIQSSKARVSIPEHEISSVPQIDHLRPVTQPLIKDSVQRRIHQEHGNLERSLSQVSDSSDSQELDLELRL